MYSPEYDPPLTATTPHCEANVRFRGLAGVLASEPQQKHAKNGGCERQFAELEMLALRSVPRSTTLLASDGVTRTAGGKCLKRLAPQVGLEPTTLRLTAECSTIELLRSNLGGHFYYIRASLDCQFTSLLVSQPRYRIRVRHSRRRNVGRHGRDGQHDRDYSRHRWRTRHSHSEQQSLQNSR